jgi:GntR family transcriptional regulator/MocR family aminotransferase
LQSSELGVARSTVLQAFDEILRLAIDPGDPVWVENPGYLGARRAVLAAGGRPVPIPVDREACASPTASGARH